MLDVGVGTILRGPVRSHQVVGISSCAAELSCRIRFGCNFFKISHADNEIRDLGIFPNAIRANHRIDDERRHPGRRNNDVRIIHFAGIVLLADVIETSIDAIRRRFGGDAVDYGSALRSARTVPDEFRRLAEKEL